MEALWTEYYKEANPVKRRHMLEKAIQDEGETEENKIRKEIYAVRYAKSSQVDKKIPADSFLALWMMMEYNKNVGGGLFGMDIKRAQKEIRKHLKDAHIQEFLDKGGEYERLMKEELCHMVRVYMNLSLTDHSYGSTLFGLMKMGSDNLNDKLREDVRAIARDLPARVDMKEELSPVTEAIARVYEEFYPFEGGLGGERALF
ncbi:MAG: hypothetical protein IIZ39_02955 [Blautia sp.]|nr:hypothetical protein [Blautia sp.]